MGEREEGTHRHDRRSLGAHSIATQPGARRLLETIDNEGPGSLLELVEALRLGRASRLCQVVGQEQVGDMRVLENRMGTAPKEKPQPPR